MTYKEIFKELYMTNKGRIKCYVVFSIFFAVFLGISNNGYIWASSDLLNTEQANMFGGPMAAMIMNIASASGFGVDPISIMAGEAAYVLFSPLLPSEYTIYLSYTGLMQFKILSVVVIIWFIVAKALRFFSISRIAGLSIEMLEKSIGRVFLITSCIFQFLQNPQIGMQAMASNGLAEKGISAVSTVAVIFLIFGVLIFSMISYTIIRTVVFAANVLLLPLSGIPFSSLCIELTKIFIVGGIFYLAFTDSTVFIICFLVGFLICFYLFRKAYILTRYFKAIYVKPLIAKIRGYRKRIPLIYPKISKKLKGYLANEDVRILIPVYAIKKVDGFKFLKRHDKWWFVSTESQQFVCKPKLFKNDFYKIELHNEDNDKMFINQALRFYEIFNLKGNEDNISKKFRRIKKEFYFVYSKEYYFRYEELKSITGFVDYKIYKKALTDNVKMSKRELKKIQKLEKLELREQKRIERRALEKA